MHSSSGPDPFAHNEAPNAPLPAAPQSTYSTFRHQSPQLVPQDITNYPPRSGGPSPAFSDATAHHNQGGETPEYYFQNEKAPLPGDMPTQTLGPGAPYAFRLNPGQGQQTGVGRVGSLARRIHGWSWQAFPIGMGTGAVYVTMSGVRARSKTLITVETIFFFINFALFVLNVSTLAAQAFCS